MRLYGVQKWMIYNEYAQHILCCGSKCFRFYHILYWFGEEVIKKNYRVGISHAPDQCVGCGILGPVWESIWDWPHLGYLKFLVCNIVCMKLQKDMQFLFIIQIEPCGSRFLRKEVRGEEKRRYSFSIGEKAWNAVYKCQNILVVKWAVIFVIPTPLCG